MGLTICAANKISLDRQLTIAVDIGFSETEPSCGLSWYFSEDAKGTEPVQFGKLAETIFEIFTKVEAEFANLIIEAPLSVCFSTEDKTIGNPRARGDWESDRRWYCGSGILTHGAALVLLKGLYKFFQNSDKTIFIYEAFSSQKKNHLCDKHEAELILKSFSLEHIVTKTPEKELGCRGINEFYHLDKLEDTKLAAESANPPIVILVSDKSRKEFREICKCENCEKRQKQHEEKLQKKANRSN